MLSETYNIDCMEYMRSLPDNAFNLAVVDPPYGDAGNVETEHRNQRGRFDRYNGAVFCSQNGNVERVCVSRTGGTWAEKYGKKS